MKKIVISLLCTLSAFVILAQPVKETSPTSITSLIQRVIAGKNFYLPKTTGAPTLRPSISVYGGVDSTGAVVMNRLDSSLYTYISGDTWLKIANMKDLFKTVKDSVKNLVDYMSLDNVSDFATFSGYTKTVIVRDTGRGGSFNIYTGTDAVDNGMIFGDAIGRKWLRQTNGVAISLKWYGARALASGDTHGSYSDIKKAINYINYHSKFNTLYIPADKTGWGYGYGIDSTIYLKKSITIIGDGTLWNPQTSLWGFSDVTPFKIFSNYGEESFTVNMENLIILGTTPTVNFDSTYGLYIRTQVHLKNLEVHGFSSHGIYITSCANVPNGDNNNYGNADHSIVEYTSTYDNGKDGIHVEGCDANIIEFNNVSSNSNKRWGIYDAGQLGNHYTQPHAAANAYSVGGGKTVVTFGGNYYSALPGYDGYFGDAADSNYNKQPDLNLGTYWQVAVPMSATAWNSTTRYYSGGAFAVTGPNAWAVLTAPYSESSQASSYLGPRAKIDGGDNGAGVYGGAWWHMYSNNQYLNNSNLIVPSGRLVVGAPDWDASSSFYSKNYSGVPFSGLFEGYNNVAGIKLKNTVTNSQYDLVNDELQWYEASTLRLKSTSAAFEPGADTLFSLGTLVSRWKNIYGKRFYGDGLNLTNVIHPFDTSGTWVNTRDSIIKYVTPTQLIPYIKTDGWYNIARDGGADTTGTNDVSSIIQGALNAGIKNILIPHGQFKISTTVQLKDSVKIQGVGAGAVIKLATNIQAFKISFALGGNLATISDLTIKGNKLSGATTAQEGVRLDSAYGFTANNLMIHNIGGAGFHFIKNGYCCGTYTLSAPRGNFINNPFVDSSYYGIVFDSTAEYNQVNGGSLNNNFIGFRNWRAGNNSFTGVNISANTHGIQLIGGGGTNDGHGNFTGCIINHNIEPLYIDSIARGYYFSNCMIYGQGYDSARIKNSDRITFTGGYFTPTKLLWENNTNSSINGVSDLLGIVTGWTLVGTAPTILKLDGSQTINKPLSYSYNLNGSLTGNNLITKSLADSLLALYNLQKVTDIGSTTSNTITSTNSSIALSTAATIAVSSAGYYGVDLTDGGNHLTRGVNVTNTSNGNSAGSGDVYTNDIGHVLYYYMSSSGNSFITDGGLIRTNGNGGLKFVADGTHAPFQFSNSLGSNVDYMRIYFDSLKHTGIPVAANMTGKKVLVWDATGNFWTISKDSVGGTGGGGSGTVTSVATNTGTGITGGTIIGSGTLALDTTLIVQTKADIQRKIDSAAVANTASFRNPNLGDTMVTSPAANTVLVKSLIAGFGTIQTPNDTTITHRVDTMVIATRDRVKQIADSAASAHGGGSGGGNVYQDANRNVFIGNVDSAYSTTATAAGTTTLTNGSKYTQNFTGSTTQTIVLPNATTLVAGHAYYITNNSTGALTVNKNGGTLLKTVAAGQTIAVRADDISTSAGGWSYEYSGDALTFKKALSITTLRIL